MSTRLQRLLAAVQQRRRLFSVGVYASTAAMPRAVNALLAVLYAAVMPATQLGAYGICLALATVVGVISDAGLTAAVMRNYYDLHQTPEQAHAYLSRIVVAARLTSAAIVGLLLIVGLWVWAPLTGDELPLWPLLPMVLTIGFLDRSTEMLATICRVQERPLDFAAGRIVQTATLIASGVALVYVLRLGVAGALLSSMLGGLAALLFLTTRLRESVRPRLAAPSEVLPELRAALAYGVPLLPDQVANWGRQMGMRLVLLQVVPMALVGLYFAGALISNVLMLLTQAMEMAFSPVYFKRRVQSGADGAAFRHKVMIFTRALLAALAPIYLALVLFSPELIRLLFPTSYADAAPVCAAVTAAAFLRIQQPFMMKQLMYLKKTRSVGVITGLPVLLSFAAVPLVVPSTGIVGAGWLVCAANAGALFAAAAAIRRHETLDFPALTALGLSVAVIGGAALIALAPLTVGAVGPLARAAIVALFATATLATLVYPQRRTLKTLLSR